MLSRRNANHTKGALVSHSHSTRVFVEKYKRTELIKGIMALKAKSNLRTARDHEIRCALTRHNHNVNGIGQGTPLALPIEWSKAHLKRIRRTELCMLFLEMLAQRTDAFHCKEEVCKQKVTYFRKTIRIVQASNRNAETPTATGCCDDMDADDDEHAPSQIGKMLIYGRQYADTNGKLSLKGTIAYDPQEWQRTVSLQGAPKEIRRFLCSGIYHDVDIENCFPNIAIHLGRQYGYHFAVLSKYTASKATRNEMLKEIIDAHRLLSFFPDPEDAREKAKRLPLTLLHGGTYAGWLRTLNVEPIQRVECMKEFANEMYLLHQGASKSQRPIERSIYSNREAFRRQTDKKDTVLGPKKGMTELERSLIAQVLQTYENQILQLILQYADKHSWVVGSLQYDGLFIEHREDACMESFLRGAEAHVQTNMREDNGDTLKIRLEEKELFHDDTAGEQILLDWLSVTEFNE